MVACQLRELEPRKQGRVALASRGHLEASRTQERRRRVVQREGDAPRVEPLPRERGMLRRAHQERLGRASLRCKDRIVQLRCERAAPRAVEQGRAVRRNVEPCAAR